MLGLLVKGIAALLAVGGITAAVVATSSGPDVDRAVVTHVVDGDTIDVARTGHTERIRLLNIDTPETVDPAQPVQCLGPEASAFLAALVPVGSTVTLEYDEERTDGNGRTLAGVFTPDGELVNAEVARAGLAVVYVVGDNDRFYPEVRDAALSAQREARGLYSPDTTCTLPGQVAELTSAVAAAPTAGGQPATATAVQLDAAASEVGTVLENANALANLLAGDHLGPVFAVFTPDDLRRFASEVEAARGTAEQEHAALRGAADGARSREAEASRRAEAEAEAARKAEADAAAARAAEQRRRAQRSPAGSASDSDDSRDSARAPAPRPQPAPAPAPRPQPAPAPAPDPDPPAPSGGSGNPYPGYTGPRCYDPGGVTWRPCPERG